MKFAPFLGIATFVMFASAAHAQRTPVPIVNHENVVIVTGSGKAPGIAAIKKAIVTAGQAGKRKWTVAQAVDGSILQATYQVRTHTIVVDIAVQETSYSVRYASSIDMRYKVEEGIPVIHPFYNNWVDELMLSIRTELVKL
jgi:hypothetical protein